MKKRNYLKNIIVTSEFSLLVFFHLYVFSKIDISICIINVTTYFINH